MKCIQGFEYDNNLAQLTTPLYIHCSHYNQALYQSNSNILLNSQTLTESMFQYKYCLRNIHHYMSQSKSLNVVDVLTLLHLWSICLYLVRCIYHLLLLISLLMFLLLVVVQQHIHQHSRVNLYRLVIPQYRVYCIVCIHHLDYHLHCKCVCKNV